MTKWTGVTRWSGLLLSALSTGVLFGTRTAVSPSTRSFTPRAYVEVQQATVRNLRPVMGLLMPAAVAVDVAVVALTSGERRSPAFALTLAGAAGQLASLLLTVAYELPINADVLTWSPDDPPEGWQAARDRWERIHTLRTVTAVVGLAGLAGAPLVPARRRTA